MFKLDKNDRLLLYQLDCNSRQTLQQLGKTVGLSKDAINYRINRFLKEEIIKSFNAVIDTGKIGHISFRLFLKFEGLPPEKEKEMLEVLLNNPNLLWFVQVEGNWDLNTWFLYPSLNEMDAFWNDYLARYGNFIQKKEFGIYSEVTYFSRAYLAEKKVNDFAMTIVTLPQKSELDDSDWTILETLSQNARTPIIELAKKARITPKTVITKMKRLEREKIILGYRAEFNLEKLGYKYYKIHLSTFNTTKERLSALKQRIKEHPNIIYQDEVIGGHDIEIETQLENEDALRRLLEDLKKEFPNMIRNHETLHYYKEHRLRFFPNKTIIPH